MGWGEIIKAINNNIQKPLNVLFTELTTAAKNEILETWNYTRATYLDTLYSQYKNRGIYLDASVSSMQTEAHAVARYNALVNRTRPVSSTGVGSTLLSVPSVCSVSNFEYSQFYTLGKVIAPVSGVFKVTVTITGLHTADSGRAVSMSLLQLDDDGSKMYWNTATPGFKMSYNLLTNRSKYTLGTATFTSAGKGTAFTQTLTGFAMASVGEPIFIVISAESTFSNVAANNLTITAQLA